jgi:aminomethyltransferase
LHDHRANPHRRRRIGLTLEGRRAAREGYEVLRDGKLAGQVTSGVLSPTLDQAIAMAYVDHWAPTAPGSEYTINVRGQMLPARVTALPFYRRPKGTSA